MKVQIFLLLLCLTTAAAAQNKTVTNGDLEKFRQKRVQAEKDYRENYAKMGFPSPEELNRQREVDKIETAKLAERYARERLEQEKADALARQTAINDAQQGYDQPSNTSFPVYDNGLFYSYGYRSPFGYRGHFRVWRPNLPSGYFAGGAFWPTPDPNKRPLFILAPPRRPRH